MSSKHKRRRSPGITQYSLYAPGRSDPALVGRNAPPRYVLANFDRWVDAKKCGDVWGASRLAMALRRAGFGVEAVWIRSGDLYRLRRLD